MWVWTLHRFHMKIGFQKVAKSKILKILPIISFNKLHNLAYTLSSDPWKKPFKDGVTIIPKHHQQGRNLRLYLTTILQMEP